MVTVDLYIDEVDWLVVDSLCVMDEELLLLLDSVVELGRAFRSSFLCFSPAL